MLTNLRHCLHFMKQLANHVLEYIDTTTTSTLTPHLIPVPDLQKMLYQIESELPPNMHMPIPSSDPLHFYRYLQSHMLVEESQFLLLIDVHIQDRAQQIQIYKIINLPVPVGNYSMRYTINNKYLGITYDRTKVMNIPEDQFKLCKEANGQFFPLTTPLQPLTNPPSCVAALYTRPGSGDDPELQGTLNHLLTRRPGCQLNYLKYSPTEWRWQCTGSAVQPRLSELNYEKDKHTLTAISSH